MMALQLPVYPSLQALLPGVALESDMATLEITGVTLDSRQVEPGFLFLAMPGDVHDGRNFIQQALSQGAAAVVADAEGLTLAGNKVIAVENLAESASGIAARFFAEPSKAIPCVGITGTNGKTTCCQLLGQLFSLLDMPTGVIGTLGSGVFRQGQVQLQDQCMTTTDAVLTQHLLGEFVADNTKAAVMEVSSHSLVQGRVEAVQFKTAIFTNLSRDHLDYHGSLENYAAAKLRLFRSQGLQHAIINRDDPLAAQILAAVDQSVRCYTYAIESAADITLSDIATRADGVTAKLMTPWGEGVLTSQLLGRFNLSNLLAVIGAACVEGFPLAKVLQVVAQLRPVDGRIEKVAAKNSDAPTVIIDYAHTPDALEKVLMAVREHCSGQLWCVFGCGGDRDTGKREPMGQIAKSLADQVIITSDNPRSESPAAIVEQVQRGAPDAQVIIDRADAIAFAIARAATEDTVLVSGKGHENYQEIAGKKHPFSDRESALIQLEKRRHGNG